MESLDGTRERSPNGIAQAHEFEIISLGGGRPHMELPEYRAAAQRLEAVQEQVIAAEQEIAALEKQRLSLIHI